MQATAFRPLNESQRQLLAQALKQNAENDRAILIDPRDTSFAGTACSAKLQASGVPEDEVISAIKSIPSHY